MNSLRILALGLAWAASAAAAQTLTGSGTNATQERDVRNFTGLDIAVPAQVEIAQGATESLRITADDNVLPEIQSVVERGVLRLKLRQGVNLRRATIRVAVQAKTLESISIAGSADVRAPQLATPKLALNIAGSGDMHLGGKADSVDVRISGSGDIRAAKLASQRTTVSISGSGDATVWTREALRVRVAGSGDVGYYGDPKVDKSIAGSGAVRRLGAAPS